MFDHYRPDGIDISEHPYWLIGFTPDPLADGRIIWHEQQQRINMQGVAATLTVAETDLLVQAVARCRAWLESRRTARVFLPDLSPEERDRIIEMFSTPPVPEQMRAMLDAEEVGPDA